MNYTNPAQQRKNASPGEKTASQVVSETQAFTERPRTDSAKRQDSTLAHDLFDLFTANIIKAKTDFFR